MNFQLLNTLLLLTASTFDTILIYPVLNSLSQLFNCVCFGTFILLLAGAKKVRILRHTLATKKISFSIQFSDRCFFSSSVVYFGSREAVARLHLLASIVQIKRTTLKKKNWESFEQVMGLHCRLGNEPLSFHFPHTIKPTSKRTNTVNIIARTHTHINRIQKNEVYEKKTSFKISFTRCLPHQSRFIKIN